MQNVTAAPKPLLLLKILRKLSLKKRGQNHVFRPFLKDESPFFKDESQYCPVVNLE